VPSLDGGYNLYKLTCLQGCIRNSKIVDNDTTDMTASVDPKTIFTYYLPKLRCRNYRLKMKNFQVEYVRPNPEVRRAMSMTDIEKTKQYYSTLGKDYVCNCYYCENYCLQIKDEYPQIAAYLASYGIDIEKPLKIDIPVPGKNGCCTYDSCEYVVFGSCPDTYNHRIGNVTFFIPSSYPDPIPERKENYWVLAFGPIDLKKCLFPGWRLRARQLKTKLVSVTGANRNKNRKLWIAAAVIGGIAIIYKICKVCSRTHSG